ncbi:hypothetical protein N9496_06595 [Akkermansiaceae bacterium]|nr:hypothetical protein [Akkermansiaceae bacterium]
MKYLLPILLLLFVHIAFAAEPVELVKLRATYDNSLRESFQKVGKLYHEELLQLKKNYMQAENLEGALAVDREIEELLSIYKQTSAPPKKNYSQKSIQVTSPSGYSVQVLKVGVSRISDLKWNTKFDWVSKDVEWWQFLRVKWKTDDIKTITFLDDSEVYIARLRSFKTSSATVKKTMAGAKATGPWMGKDANWYRVSGKAGDSFQCDGRECLIVAKSFK